MYKQLFKVFLTALVVLALSGCSKNDDPAPLLTVSPETLSLEYAGETLSVKLTTNASWRVNVPKSADWCKIEPLYGRGDATLSVTVDPNLSFSNRTVTVSFIYGDDNSKVTYTVTQEALSGKGDYLDGEIRAYEINRETKPVNIVFLGDGFTAADYTENGAFDKAVKEGAEALFGVEPYKTYRKYFNIYKIAVFSKQQGATYEDEGVVRETAFNTAYHGGSSMTTDDDKIFSYAERIQGLDLNETGIILIVNDERYGGTTMMYSTGRSVAICPMNRYPELPGGFGNILVHEAGGHGFGGLADEYTNGVETPPTDDEITELKAWFSFGYYDNVDITGNPDIIKWRNFVGLPGYGAVGAYEGGYYHEVGIWRPEYISCMDDNRSYFNAPSRAAIVKRLLTIAGETFTLDGFVAKDAVKAAPVWLPSKSAIVRGGLPRLAPPIMIDDRK